MSLEIRQLTINDKEAFFEGLSLFSDMDRDWYTFVWKEGMSYEDHLNILKDQSLGQNLAPDRVPASMLYAFLNGKIVGRSSIRHKLNDFLSQTGGHIGYAVATPYRNQGIATNILKQSLQYCRDVLKLERVLVTCDDNNIGSYRTIEKNNGILENIVFAKSESVATRRYWIDLIPKATLREASQTDAKNIALVHYQSWIETYTGLMPDGLLEKISLESREKLWTMILADPKRCIWIAETSEGEIVGFLSVCPGRDERYKDYGEIPGLYLLKKYHSQGIGASLLRKGIALLKEQGFKNVYLWVLKDNPAELFYQKMGGKMDGEQELELDGYKMIEVFYVWNDYKTESTNENDL